MYLHIINLFCYVLLSSLLSSASFLDTTSIAGNMGKNKGRNDKNYSNSGRHTSQHPKTKRKDHKKGDHRSARGALEEDEGISMPSSLHEHDSGILILDFLYIS